MDVGDRRIGLAVSDPMGILATPRGHIERRGDGAAVIAVLAKAAEHGAGGIVVGMPLDRRGGMGPQALKVSEFCRLISEATELPVTTWDERYSTAVAEDRLRQAGRKPSRDRGRADAAAAAVILQSYLDAARETAPKSAT